MLNGNYVMMSNSEIREWEVDMEKKEEAAGIQVVGWKLVTLLPEDKEQTVNLCREWATGRSYLGVESTGNKLERKAKWFQEVLHNVVDATPQKIGICAWPTRWWNCEIKEM
jgi:hypothetical protein